jgi:uncharacterized membrane protein
MKAVIYVPDSKGGIADTLKAREERLRQESREHQRQSLREDTGRDF